MSALENILSRLDNVRSVRTGYTASCPCPEHGQGRGDVNPSLSIGVNGEGTVLLKCFANCDAERIVEALGLTMHDLFESRNGHKEGGSGSSPKTGSTDQPCTLGNYATYLRLPVSFLKGLGLKEYRHLGDPAISMPYLDESGENLLLTRSRVSLTGKPKVKTRKGDKHRLYGLWRLEEARKAGYVWLVEGESDTQTLWYHGEPAVGIPGANGWKAEWTHELEGIERIYFVVEDEAGEACWQKLAATPELQESLWRVDLEDVKDVSELHRQDPEGFRERLSTARIEAKAWMDIAESKAEEDMRTAWRECCGLAEEPDILGVLAADLSRLGLVGEVNNAKLLYLILNTRHLEKIVSAAIKGVSAAGKSHLLKRVLNFFPDSAFCFFTAMSERTLLYTDEPLDHRHIIFSEAAGIGEFQDYIIRTLLSEGFLEYEFVEKTSEGLRPRRIRKEGPTGFITTTTRDRLHAENETRYLTLTATDTREQTRRIFRALAQGEDSEQPDHERWHALQRWIEGAEHHVTIPYAGALAEKTADVAVRLRRDFSVVLSLVKSHAILHQATRERDEKGRVVATLDDYARVRELVAELIAEGVEATVPPTIRETVEAVGRLLEDSDEEWVTNKAIAEELNIDKAAASRRVRAAINRSYLKNLEDRKGHPARLRLGESMSEDQEILPTPEDFQEAMSGCAVDREPKGIKDPPPPPVKEHEWEDQLQQYLKNPPGWVVERAECIIEHKPDLPEPAVEFLSEVVARDLWQAGRRGQEARTRVRAWLAEMKEEKHRIKSLTSEDLEEWESF